MFESPLLRYDRPTVDFVIAPVPSNIGEPNNANLRNGNLALFGATCVINNDELNNAT